MKKNLNMIFANLNRDLVIHINFNMDGLPLFNSSKYEFWPILANIFGNRYILAFDVCSMDIQIKQFLEFPQIRPFVVAVWCGEGKPLVNEFLRQFVDELNMLIRNGGITINNHALRIKTRAFILDTPARSYIKGNNICMCKML